MNSSAPESILRTSFFFALVALLCMAGAGDAFAEGPAPKILFDPASPEAHNWVAPNDGSEAEVTSTLSQNGIDVAVRPNGKSSYPGIKITPMPAWDAGGFGHIEIKVTNNGQKPIRVNLRLDNEGPWQENRWSANIVTVKAGQTTVVPTIFGYQYGRPGYALKPEAIFQATIFTAKSDVPQAFHIEAIQAAGPVGEKPYIDPNTVSNKPAEATLFDGSATIDPVKQLVAKGGAKAALAAEGKIRIDFIGANDQSVTFKPVVGMWNLNEYLQVQVRLKNTGTVPITPAVQLIGRGGPSEIISTGEAIAPGAEAQVIVPFAAKVPWIIPAEHAQEVLEGKKDWIEPVAGTGTKYTSNTTTGVSILSDKSAGTKNFEIISIVAGMPPQPERPAWLGQRPPVDGEWTKTFDDNFDGGSIDLSKWSIYTEGDWHLGAQTHYSKDSVIVKDGTLALRVEKKLGHQNDDPAKIANDYASGYAYSYGKWTQRYGYFEARMKLPTAPGMFPAFWLMPDRGLAVGNEQKRASTKEGGMEFDIMETQAFWGVNRHDWGMHWDSYQKYHKSCGMFTAYAQPDKEGFITVGMLWTPGLAVLYDNGKETARWESPRISNVPSYFILDNILGGWETEPLDDKQLPSDFVVDYVRAWQRKDLASDVDGPKPNNANPLPPTNENLKQ